MFLLVPVMNHAGPGRPVLPPDVQPDLFSYLNLSEKGLASEVYRLALKGYRKLESSGKLRNSGILTIVDFSQSSKNKRLYVIDILHKVLLFNTYVAHGRNTGEEFAQHFSNVLGSCQSSLGFYVTKQETTGSCTGLSLVLDGMEKGFNDNALRREIIIHGARYATEDFIKKTGRLGRSFGCPSLPPDLVKAVVETIKEGTCLFIYHNDPRYIGSSSLLN
ncbi:MAG: murein L,D-transpeptidase catalytic domain family protein [Bacteroidota bacterium]